MGSSEGRDPVNDYEIINKEILEYGKGLEKKKQVIIANKMDLEGSTDNLNKFKKKYPKLDVVAISAFDLTGVEILVKHLADIIDEYVEEINISNEEVVYKFVEEEPFTIRKENGMWVIEGKRIEKLFKMTKFNEEESVIRFANKLKKMGVEEELINLGAEKGDDVAIMDYIFQFKD